MNSFALPLGALLCCAPLLASVAAPTQADRVTSEIRRTEVGERILVHELELEASVEEVWKAYTTDAGWMAWAAPAAAVDLRVGGTIRTAYEGVTLGEEGTNTLHILNYVPREVLTLKADIGANWPEVLKQDGERLSNVILFDELGSERTRVRSYGIGYGDSAEYEELLQFFLRANEGLLKGLKRYVETGERTDW